MILEVGKLEVVTNFSLPLSTKSTSHSSLSHLAQLSSCFLFSCVLLARSMEGESEDEDEDGIHVHLLSVI